MGFLVCLLIIFNNPSHGDKVAYMLRLVKALGYVDSKNIYVLA
jgi:hypothetical protein